MDIVAKLGERRRNAVDSKDEATAQLIMLARRHVGKDVTASRFAKAAGVPPSTVTRWLTEEHKASG